MAWPSTSHNNSFNYKMIDPVIILNILGPINTIVVDSIQLLRLVIDVNYSRWNINNTVNAEWYCVSEVIYVTTFNEIASNLKQTVTVDWIWQNECSQIYSLLIMVLLVSQIVCRNYHTYNISISDRYSYRNVAVVCLSMAHVKRVGALPYNLGAWKQLTIIA